MSNDIEQLQGTWEFTSLEIEGQALPEQVFLGSKIIIDGDRFRTESMGAEYTGTYTVDTTTTPKRLDMIFVGGPEKGNRSLGIYEIDGDSWKICLTIRGNQRPTEFTTRSNSGHVLETLVRAASGAGKNSVDASAKHDPPPASTKNSTASTASELQGEWAMVSGMIDGLPMDESMVRSAKRVTVGDETTVTFGGQVYSKATFIVDRSASPIRVEFTHSAGIHKGKKQSGIFELKGGLLTVSIAPPGKDALADFSSHKGDGLTVTVWKKK